MTVSHDRYFLDKVADQDSFEDGKIRPSLVITQFILTKKPLKQKMATQSSAKRPKEKVVKVREDKKRMTTQESRWASIEGDIEALENRIALKKKCRQMALTLAISDS